MKIYFSKSLNRKVSKLIKKNPKFKKTLIKQLKLFEENHQHSSLKFHKLKGKRSQQFAIKIEDNLRALLIRINDEYLFVNLITHDEY